MEDELFVAIVTTLPDQLSTEDSSSNAHGDCTTLSLRLEDMMGLDGANPCGPERSLCLRSSVFFFCDGDGDSPDVERATRWLLLPWPWLPVNGELCTEEEPAADRSRLPDPLA